MPVEMVVDRILMSLVYPHRIVVLKDTKRDRYLPIIIGMPESDAIALKLQNADVPRPQTHDLLYTMVTTLGGRMTHIVVNDLTGDTFFARIVMDVDGRHVEVDSRPSDAIALAVRANVPIYVEEAVLERVAAEREERSGASQEKTEEAIGEEQLGAFRDIINQLNLDDFGGKS